VHTKINIKLI